MLPKHVTLLEWPAAVKIHSIIHVLLPEHQAKE